MISYLQNFFSKIVEHGSCHRRRHPGYLSTSKFTKIWSATKFDLPLKKRRSSRSFSAFSGTRISKNYWLTIPITYSIALFLYSQWAAIIDPLAVNDDVVQHLLWLYRYADNNFVPDDLIVNTSELLQPWGYWLLCRLLALLLDPITISKYCSLLPLTLTAVFTFGLIRERYGLGLAIVGMILMCNFPMERMIGFNARAFGYPLVLAFLYYFADENHKGISLVLVLSALFYPVALVIGSLISFSWMLWNRIAYKNSSLFSTGNLVQTTGIGCGVLIVLSKSRQVQSSPILGSIFSKQQIISRPEFSTWGRVNFEYELDPALMLNFDWHHLLRIPKMEFLFWILLVAFLVHMIYQRKVARLDFGLLGLLLSGLVLGFLAQQFFPALFLPQRYVFYSWVPFFYLLVVRVLGIARTFFGRYLPALIIVSLFAYEGFKTRNPFGRGLKYYHQYEALYETIRELPGRPIIAAPPSEASHIPMFCQYSVLFSSEAAHAVYFTRQNALMMPRFADFLEAYASSELEQVRNFVRKYHVDYILIKKSFFRTNKMSLFVPFHGQLETLTAGKTEGQYSLMQLPESWIEEIDEEYALLNCAPLLK